MILDLYWKLRNRFSPVELARAIKTFYQRGRRGYADSDLWSLDWYLLEILPSALKKLSQTTHSYPPNITYKRWQKTLGQMQSGFEAGKQLLDLDYDLSDKKKQRQLQTTFDKGMLLFHLHFFDLWD
jgi:hypothetical protein